MQKLRSNVEWHYNKHEESTLMWTTEDRWLHRLSNASSTHALGQMHEQIQPNAREHRPVPHALTQVPQKTPLGTKQHWHRTRACAEQFHRPLREHKRSLLLTPLNYIYCTLQQNQCMKHWKQEITIIIIMYNNINFLIDYPLVHIETDIKLGNYIIRLHCHLQMVLINV